MNNFTKAVFLISMTTALLFGFAHPLFPGVNFERLHIFLFNLCTGGTIILIFSEGEKGFSPRTGIFFILSIAYALCAFAHIYIAAIIIAIILSLIAESIRIKRFSFFPYNFFQKSGHVSEKFHHASLLCLSMGLFISALVVWNNEFSKIITVPKLTLDVFFLGFSFPVSLITLSLMFGMMEKAGSAVQRFLKVFCFWSITMGVIIFFGFILLELQIAEFIIASTLFLSVLIVFVLYIKLGHRTQSRAFLTSGIIFLIMTAISGIAYIVLYFFLPQSKETIGRVILRVHALISLYGWNLNGLIVICRYDDFPIELHSAKIITFHWAIVLFLAPLGFYYNVFATAAVLLYALFLGIVLFTRKSKKETPCKTGRL